MLDLTVNEIHSNFYNDIWDYTVIIVFYMGGSKELAVLYSFVLYR